MSTFHTSGHWCAYFSPKKANTRFWALFQQKQKHSSPEATFASSMTNSPEGTENLEDLGKKFNLVVPLSVKECRIKGETRLASRAQNDVIKHSLIILQASIGRDKPSDSEFELCAQKVIVSVPELKDPLPPINKSAFKQWLSVHVSAACHKHTCHKKHAWVFNIEETGSHPKQHRYDTTQAYNSVLFLAKVYLQQRRLKCRITCEEFSTIIIFTEFHMIIECRILC